MTLQTQLVLRAFLADPLREMYGLQLLEGTGLPSGTLYPIMARLEQCGWLESQWEAPEAHVAEGRPRRRYYRLTREGAASARTAMDRVERARRAAPKPRIAGA